MSAQSDRLALTRFIAWAWRFRTLHRVENALGAIPSGTVLSRRFAGGRISLEVSRSSTHRLLFVEGERFVAERFLLRSLVAPNATIVDVGANIGYTSLLLAQAAGRGGRVLSFEPSSTNLVELRRNCSATAFAPIRVEGKAVGDRCGRTRISRELNATVTASAETEATEEVEVVVLDGFLEEPPDLIKIDVEGFEEKVLAGARQTLEQHRPNLFLELHPQLLPGVEASKRIVSGLSRHYGRLEFYRATRGRARSLAARYFERWKTERIGNIDEAIASARDDGSTIWVIARRTWRTQTTR
jgi:FkbM family methyltransferase